MGFTPAQVDQMSVWEFGALVQGYNRAHSENKPEPPSEDEFDQAVSRMMH